MRVEIVGNLIEAMDFVTFRAFAHQCIAQRGYKAVVSDGWSDGGRDLRVYTPDGNVIHHIAFQISVEWEWKSKLWEDVVKAKNKLGCTDFTYVTNRRIGDAVFEPLRLRALTEEQVHLSKIDKQDLAEQVVDTGKLPWFTEFLKVPTMELAPTPASLRTEVADAFVLFSNDANEFRDRIAEHAILVSLLRKGPLDQRRLISDAAEIMDYNDENRIIAAVDRLQQAGSIQKKSELFTLSPEAAQRYNSAHSLASADRDAYRRALRTCLNEFIGANIDLDTAVSRIEEILGTVVRRYADYQLALLKDDEDASDIRQAYSDQVQRVETAVHEAGVPLDRVSDAIVKINAVAKAHPVVTRLVAGDIFRRLVPSKRSSLLNAMGRVRGVTVVLEPTVVIPLLCYRLYKEAAGNRHLRAARWLFQRASSLHVAFEVPDVYVEECAVHLMTAGQYVNVFQKVGPAELAYSENAFVAFYAALAEDGSAPPFKTFLELFGFEASGDWYARVGRVTASIRRILHSYDIAISDVRDHRTNYRIKRVAEQDISHIYHRHGVDKPAVLERHDVSVLAFIRENAEKLKDAILLATWDHTLQEACRMDEYDWWCLDPLHAGDLMALAEPGGSGALGVDVALLLDDSDLKLASRVWDTIIRIEKDKMFDADMIARAVKFRKEFLQQQTSDTVASQRIAKSWDAAKIAADEADIANESSQANGAALP